MRSGNPHNERKIRCKSGNRFFSGGFGLCTDHLVRVSEGAIPSDDSIHVRTHRRTSVRWIVACEYRTRCPILACGSAVASTSTPDSGKTNRFLCDGRPLCIGGRRKLALVSILRLAKSVDGLGTAESVRHRRSPCSCRVCSSHPSSGCLGERRWAGLMQLSVWA